MAVQGSGASPTRAEPIRFRGRNRSDAKRKALNFWYTNQRQLGLDIRTFSERLKLLPDGRTIVFESAGASR